MTMRVHFLVQKGIQLRLASRLLLLIVLFSVFIVFETFITIWPVVSEAIPEDLMEIVRNKIFFRMIFFAIPVIFVIAACSIVLTHRIVGPISRLEEALEKLAKGEDVEHIRVRKTDELKELTSRINDLIGILKKPKTSQG